MAKEIILHNGSVALVDDEDFQRLSQFHWLCSDKGYAYRYIWRNKKQIRIYMHFDILTTTNQDEECDHRNRNSLDNTRSNIRPCTRSDNVKNRGRFKNSNSKYKGVFRLKSGKWKAQISNNHVHMALGDFYTEKRAALAYDAAARYYHKEFACTNFEGTECKSAEETRADARRETKNRRTSKYRGVSFRRDINKWEASIAPNRKQTHLGYYASELEAARVYDEAARKYFDESARLNFQ